MKRTHADGTAILVIGAIVLLGGVATWQAYREWIALGEMGGHMGSSMMAIHATNPVWYLLGTILVASVVGGVYVFVRDRIVSAPRSVGETTSESNAATAELDATDDRPGSPAGGTESARRTIDLLPDDERRILEPVLDSPGLTQIELRDRAAFSKSKVSQTVTDLEKRGLLYREPQGRTYRVYPSDDLEPEQDR